MTNERFILETLQAIAGKDNVVTDKKELKNYVNDGSLVKYILPLCAVKPVDVDEVQAVVRMANREKIALFPFSSGTTYQGAHYPTERGIIVDLRRMNRIDLIDKVARNAIIEPGVTFAQLAEEAEKSGLKPMTPVGAPEHASVVATYLENTPLYLWPKYKTWETLNVKMVMPKGEIMGTGQMAIPASDRPYHWATNFAVLNKMFFGAQGTLGIGIKAAITLRNIIEDRKYLFVPLKGLENFGEFSQQIMRQEANDEFFAVNRIYLANMIAKNRDETGKIIDKLPEWTAVIGLSGNDAHEIGYKELDIRDVLKRFALKSVDGFSGAENIGKRIKMEIDHPKGMLQQKKYMGENAYIPCMLSKTQLNPLYDLTEQASNKRKKGFFIMPLNFGGSYYFEINLYFDPGDKKEKENTKGLIKNISRSLIHAGAFFPRPYPLFAEEIYFRMGEYHRKIKMLKELYDPNNIMNPGKLALK